MKFFSGLYYAVILSSIVWICVFIIPWGALSWPWVIVNVAIAILLSLIAIIDMLESKKRKRGR